MKVERRTAVKDWQVTAENGDHFALTLGKIYTVALEGVQGQVDGCYQQICDVAATNLYRAEQAEASLANVRWGLENAHASRIAAQERLAALQAQLQEAQEQMGKIEDASLKLMDATSRHMRAEINNGELLAYADKLAALLQGQREPSSLAILQAQLEQQNDVCVRLLRMFEPALSSRIPPIEEVLARAASLVALEARICDCDYD